MRRPSVLLATVVLVAAGTAGIAAASPQPYPLCGPCFGPGGDVGENVTVTESRVTVKLHENGSATWIVRNTLDGDGVDELRDDGTDLDSVGRESTDRRDVRDVGYGGEPARDVTAELDGNTMVIRFADPGAATPSYGDALVVSYFRFRDYNPGILVNADRFALSGPEGYTLRAGSAAVVGDDYGTVDGDAVVLHGRAMDPGRTFFRADADLVYAPEGAHSPTASIALLWADRDAVVDNLLVVFGPGIVLAGLVAAVTGGITAGGVSRAAFVALGVGGALVHLVVLGVVADLAGFYQIWPVFTVSFSVAGFFVGVVAGGIAGGVARFGPAVLRND